VSIVVEPNSDSSAPAPNPVTEPADALVVWINGYLVPWRTHRDTEHKADWDQFYRLWRCMWTPEEKNRKSERSKLMSPGTMQAVDSTVSEIEEAVFGRQQWFDIDEDLREAEETEQKVEILQGRDKLLEKFEEHKVPKNVSKAFLIGAVYGTSIVKVNTDVKKYRYLKKDPQTGVSIPAEREQVCVEAIPLEPYEFIPDPSTDEIEDMLGMAHETPVPIHLVYEKIRDGSYRNVKVTEWTEGMFGNLNQSPIKNACLITEWHGKVPAKYLLPYMDQDKLSDEEKASYAQMSEHEHLIEAIVTIMNRGTLLAAKPNPFFMKDRSFVAAQHDTIPGYFWGRGVPEKGYHSQKALDAELRARIDAMALAAHPMLAGDITRLPRGFNLAVYPGKFWPTTGDPSQIVQPFQFQNTNTATFNQAAELQSMLQGATGAMDPVSSLGQGGGATDRAINSSAFIKRAKRTMLNIERDLLQPLVQKAMWRYVQFDPTNFPQDYTFRVKGAMGVMQREIEAQQSIQLLSVVPAESPMHNVLLKNIVDSSSSPNKAEMVAAVDALINPPQDEEAQAEAQFQKEMQKRMLVAQVSEVETKAAKAQADANLSKAKEQQVYADIDDDDENQQMEAMGLAIDLKEANAFEQQNKNAEMMTQLRAAEIALKAVQAQISMEKVKIEARKVSMGKSK
jgi:hypothetical protein